MISTKDTAFPTACPTAVLALTGNRARVQMSLGKQVNCQIFPRVPTDEFRGGDNRVFSCVVSRLGLLWSHDRCSQETLSPFLCVLSWTIATCVQKGNLLIVAFLSC